MKLTKTKLKPSTILSAFALTSLGLTTISLIIPAYADTPAASSSSANASITVSNTISLTLTGGDLVISSLSPGAASDSNIITATITSNSPYGYHISATTGTSTGTTSLVNTADSNYTFNSLSSNKATLNDFQDSTWGYSYSTDNGTNWISGDYGSTLNGYNGLPLDHDDSGATGTTLYNTDSYAGSTAIKFKIGAKSAATQASGTYTGTVNFYAVTNLGPDNTMQGFAAGNANTTCSAMATGDTLTLKDSRDNTDYTIGKLADGHCWLLDNLALDLTNSTVLNGMSESNTNASNTTLGYLKNGGGTTSDQYAITGVINWTDSPTYASRYSYSDPLVNLTNKGTIPTDATSTAGGYKVGGYYNYCAASAGSYCYGNGISVGTSTGNATEDICPKGWRMPIGNTNTSGEYFALANAIYSSTGSTSDATTYVNYRSALHLPLSGYFDSGAARSQGSGGFFWSSTRYSDYTMYDLYVDTSSIIIANNRDRDDGNSVRCILGS